MPQSLDRLFYLLTLLTREHGLSAMAPDERRIFDFLVEEANGGKVVTMSVLLTQKMMPRASAYRHVSAVIAKGYIEEVIVEGERVLTVAKRFDALEEALKDLVRADN